MHKPAQVELQLDRPQLPYSKILEPIIAGGSPAHYCRRQPNPTKKGLYKGQSTLQVDYKAVGRLLLLQQKGEEETKANLVAV